MAINTETHKEEHKELSYPCLMRATSSGLVVLFILPQTGFVVVPNDDYPVGTFLNCWMSVTDKGAWLPSPPVTLSNA